MPIRSNLPSEDLIAIASDSIASSSVTLWRGFEATFPEASPLAPLYECKNGFVAFESAFICLPVEGTPFCPELNDFQASPPWRDDPACPVYSSLVFAANCIGEVFALKRREVLHVDLVSEELLSQWADVDTFCGDLLSNYQCHTAYDLVRAWQVEHGALPIGGVLSPKLPFLLGGEYLYIKFSADDSALGVDFQL